MTWTPGPLKHWLSLNDAGTWGGEPMGVDDTPVVRSTEIGLDGTWNLDEIALRAIPQHEVVANRLRVGDLVVVKSSGSPEHLGKTAIVGPDVERIAPCFSNFVQRLRPSREADSRYVWYVLNSSRASAEMELLGNTTTGLRNLTGSTIGSVTFPGPTLVEQRQIAAFLDTETARIDALVTKKLRLINMLNERATTATDLLVLGADQMPGVPSRTGFFHRVPAAWAETTMRHLGCLVQTGPFGSQLHAEDYVDDGWPVVNPANIKNGTIVAIDSMMVSDTKRAELFRHILRPGDIVFGRRGEMGRAGLVSDENAGWLCGTGSLRLRLTGSSMLRPDYLTLLLQTSALRCYFELTSVGSTMDNLNADIVLGMPCIVPSQEEQASIVVAVRAVRSQTAALTSRLADQIDLLQEHRQALITAAVTGEMEVSGVAA